LHAISPQEDTDTTPVLTVTGAPVGGRPTLASKDVVSLKTKLDKLNVPKTGRVLVLCPEHLADLLNEDRTFYQSYHNAKDGSLATMYYGFKIYEANYTPTYTAGEKVAFGAADGAQVASIVFHNKTAVKATGTVARYSRDSKDDPENREHTLGFRLWFIGVAIRDEGIGALVG